MSTTIGKLLPYLNSSANILVRLFNSFGYFLGLAFLLPLNEYGNIAFYFTLYSVSLQLQEFGFRKSVVRDIASGTYPLDQKFYNERLAYKILFTFVPVLVMIYGFIYSDSGRPIELIFFIIASVLSSISDFHYAIFHSQGKFQLEYRSLLLNSVFCLLSFLMVAIIKNTFYASLGFLLGNLAAFLYSSSLLKQFSIKLPHLKSLYIRKQIITDTKIFYFDSLSTFLFGNIDLLIVQRLTDKEIFGAYQLLNRLIIGATFLTVVLAPVLIKKFSEGYENKKIFRSYSRKFYLLCSLGGIITASAIAGFVFIIGGYFESVPLDIVKTNILPVCGIILAKFVVFVPSMALIISKNQLKRIVFLWVVTIFGSAINIIFIPQFGITAAYYTFFGVHILLVIYMHFVYSNIVKDVK